MSCVALTYVVVRAVPATVTPAPRTNPVPFTVIVVAVVVRTGTELGLTVIALAGAGLLTVRVDAFDEPPPGVGLMTVTLRTVPLACSATDRLKPSNVALVNVVEWATPLT